uniref:AN1-type domain-containing protein n=2 Tax=Spongospora subterranea TaxID=70186 RepID=A0A0H5QKZ6_9EUKA|eukprot:CRZ02026.1 hypothetical protein [Spongospora subterranea]
MPDIDDSQKLKITEMVSRDHQARYNGIRTELPSDDLKTNFFLSMGHALAHDAAIDKELFELKQTLDTRMRKLAMKTSFAHIRKILENILKNPANIKSRRVLMKNFAYKKFIGDVPRVLAFMKTIGFVAMNDDVLEIGPDVNVEFFKGVILKLDAKTTEIDFELSQPPDDAGPRKQCAGRCGFFGNPETDDYCSLCFRSRLAGKDPATNSAECISQGCVNFGNPSKDKLCNKCWHDREERRKSSWVSRTWWLPLQRAKAKLRAIWWFQQGCSPRPIQVDLRKCWACSKKIPLTAVACRCGYIFCSNHRSTLDHDCTFNFRRAHKVRLQQLNPQIQGKKFDRLD